MKGFLLIGVLLFSSIVFAQQDSMIFVSDSTQSEMEKNRAVLEIKKPDPIKAVWLGTILPGAGQIYNGSYWKLPIVYGAFMGCGYAISWNQNRYSNYKTAYLDLYNDINQGTVSEDESKSYIAVLPDGYNLQNVGGESKWMSTLQNRQNIYRRYRDYSILATVIVYALSLIDAYVDAQLFDYDISPDLSINVEPQIYYDPQYKQSTELKLAILF